MNDVKFCQSPIFHLDVETWRGDGRRDGERGQEGGGREAVCQTLAESGCTIAGKINFLSFC